MNKYELFHINVVEKVEYGTHACTHAGKMGIPKCDKTLLYTGKVDKMNE